MIIYSRLVLVVVTKPGVAAVFSRSDPTPSSEGLDDASSSGSDVGYDAEDPEAGHTAPASAIGSPVSNGNGHGTARVAGHGGREDDERAQKTPAASSQAVDGVGQEEGAERDTGAAAGETLAVGGMDDEIIATSQ